MIKRMGSVEVNTDTMQIFQNGVEVKLPYDVHKAYEVMCTFEYLKDTYINPDDTLWQLAREVREVQSESEANGNPITEGEAIEIACNSLNITLWEA